MVLKIAAFAKKYAALIAVVALVIAAVALTLPHVHLGSSPAKPKPVASATVKPSPKPSPKPSSPAPAPKPTPTPPPMASPADLRITAQEAPGGGTAGSTYYDLVFTNIADHAVTMYGYPGVIAVDANGTVGAAAVREDGATESTVTLQPGDVAYALLRVLDVGALVPVSEIEAVTSVEVYIPDATVAVDVPLSINAITTDQLTYMTIYPVSTNSGN